eukprot:3368111-Amphidinium_carterae.1
MIRFSGLTPVEGVARDTAATVSNPRGFSLGLALPVLASAHVQTADASLWSAEMMMKRIFRYQRKSFVIMCLGRNSMLRSVPHLWCLMTISNSAFFCLGEPI